MQNFVKKYLNHFKILSPLLYYVGFIGNLVLFPLIKKNFQQTHIILYGFCEKFSSLSSDGKNFKNQ